MTALCITPTVRFSADAPTIGAYQAEMNGRACVGARCCANSYPGQSPRVGSFLFAPAPPRAGDAKRGGWMVLLLLSVRHAHFFQYFRYVTHCRASFHFICSITKRFVCRAPLRNTVEKLNEQRQREFYAENVMC